MLKCRFFIPTSDVGTSCDVTVHLALCLTPSAKIKLKNVKKKMGFSLKTATPLERSQHLGIMLPFVTSQNAGFWVVG